MIRGIGTDIIEVERIAKMIRNYGDRFTHRLFSAAECDYCQRYSQSARHFAGRFAAKEAVVKALGVGFREGISWLDIQVLNNSLGQPHVILTPLLIERFSHPHIQVSISHCNSHATATAIWES